MTSPHQLNYPSPPPLSTRTIMGHPPGLFLLFFVEMWERFSYYGMRALLVLYLKAQSDIANAGRNWAEEDATNLYGWYTGLAYLAPVFGGIIADKVIGTHRSMLIGGLLIALGHITLAISGIGHLSHDPAGMSVFVMGLGLIVFGTGHFKPTVSVMVGQLYPPDDPRRDGAFTIFYMGINVGAFISAFICGTLGEKIGWHWGFGAAAVGMILGLLTYMLGRPVYLRNIGAPPEGKPNRAPLFVVGAIILSAAFALLYHFQVYSSTLNGIGHLLLRLSDQIVRTRVGGFFDTATGRFLLDSDTLFLLLSLASLATAGSIWFVRKQEPADRGPTACILLFIVFNMIFWFAFEQAGTSLNLFAADMTNRYIGSWEMPATWFQSVNPLLIIVLAPVFAWMWSRLAKRNANPSQPMKIALGLLLVGGGYVFMVVGSIGTSPAVRAGMVWLTATYTLHTLGELCISPTGLSFVTRAAPAKYVSLLMGLWFLSNFVANKVGGQVAGLTQKIADGDIKLFWYRWFRLGGRADFFLLFVILGVAAGLVILALTPKLKKMLAGRE